MGVPEETRTGPQQPLSGLRVLEMAAIGPVPHLGTVLLNMGASVRRIKRRVPEAADFAHTFYAQGKDAVEVDVRTVDGRSAVLELMAETDVLIEGMRPGVMERLGLGPEKCLKRNPSLIYARVTGYGQSGPLAQKPGHDINYIAQSGALNGFRRGRGKPVPPINVVGDFAGGSLHGAVSILAAMVGLKSGLAVEQVLDIAMVDGSAALMTMDANIRHALGPGGLSPLANAPYYDVYECADSGMYVAVGAAEPQFFSELLRVTGIEFPDDGSRDDPLNWPRLGELLTGAFRSRTRAEWEVIGAESESCISGVIALDEAPGDAHMSHRIALQGVRGAVGGALHPQFYLGQGS